MSALTYLSAASGTADVQLRAAPVPVRGFSARETTGNSASFVLRDGTTSSDPGVVMVNLAAYEAIQYEFAELLGIQFTHGVFLDRVSGSTEVAVWV